RRFGCAIFQGIVVDDLDVVRAFGDTRVHKGLRLLSAGDGRDVYSVLRAMPSGSGDQDTSGPKVSLVGKLAGRLVFLNRLAVLDAAEHIQFRGHAERQGLNKMRRPKYMYMAVDQARKQTKTIAGDHLGPRRLLDQA